MSKGTDFYLLAPCCCSGIHPVHAGRGVLGARAVLGFQDVRFGVVADARRQGELLDAARDLHAGEAERWQGACLMKALHGCWKHMLGDMRNVFEGLLLAWSRVKGERVRFSDSSKLFGRENGFGYPAVFMSKKKTK